MHDWNKPTIAAFSEISISPFNNDWLIIIYIVCRNLKMDESRIAKVVPSTIDLNMEYQVEDSVQKTKDLNMQYQVEYSEYDSTDMDFDINS